MQGLLPSYTAQMSQDSHAFSLPTVLVPELAMSLILFGKMNILLFSIRAASKVNILYNHS